MNPFHKLGKVIMFLQIVWSIILEDPDLILENHKRDPYKPWIVRVQKIKKSLRGLFHQLFFMALAFILCTATAVAVTIISH